MIVTVSGATYEGCCNPLATGVPEESGWPEPTRRKMGKGSQLRYDVSAELARLMLDHFETMSYLNSPDCTDSLDAHVEGRAIARDAARLRAQLGASS